MRLMASDTPTHNCCSGSKSFNRKDLSATATTPALRHKVDKYYNLSAWRQKYAELKYSAFILLGL